jgi:protein-S-isoprenylcysteine O-methyltransferase Ste14
MAAVHFLLPVARFARPPHTYLGLAPLAIGLAISIWGSELFKRRRTTIKPFERSTELVVEGPYRFSRHPMYLGMVMALGGLAILLGSMTPLVIVAVFGWLMNGRFIAPEERAMDETFGEAYVEYKRRVRRWI